MICPNCNAENRSGAKFCRECGKDLPSPANTTPIVIESTSVDAPLLPPPDSTQRNPEPHPVNTSRTDTRPLTGGASFEPRPPLAIFGDGFISEQLLFCDEHQQRYQVSEIGEAESRRIRQCSNPACGAIHWRKDNAPEAFCTACGAPLGLEVPALVLLETRSPLYEGLDEIMACSLTHENVRAPITAFSESVGGGLRYCVVLPDVAPMPETAERSQILHWGIGLAYALDYLHANGISFGGQVNESRFGLTGDRAVWSNFSGCNVHPDMLELARQADVNALAMHLFQWVTGRSLFAHDPNLAPSVNAFFEQAFSPPGFTNSTEMAGSLEQALEELAAQVSLDYRSGRRTDVGKERTLNEDSLLVIEMDRVLESNSQPVGLYLVADGMGGHAAGEVASGTIINVIAEKALKEMHQIRDESGASIDRAQWVSELVALANKTLFDLRKSAGTDMGSTLVMAVLEGDKAVVAHVGDSRAYLLNSKEIKQITVDHSLVERLIATNQITREEARYHPQRNVIYRTMGDKPSVEVDASVQTLKPGERLLLCSDGLSGMLEDSVIHQVVRESPDPQTACDQLITAANAAGGEDNITAILIEIRQV